MEHYRFFNSTEGDIREYRASEFAEYFSRFLTDGLYTENGNAGLKVNVSNGLNINIDTGYAFVRGYMYHNDMVITKTLDAADSILDRIDRIVLRFDEVDREIKIIVKKGILSSTPVATNIEVTTSVKEMTLAQVRIRKGITTISANDITDERLKDTCGLVQLLAEVPLNDLMEQWNTWFEGRQNETGGRVFGGATESSGMLAGDIWHKELV